jgi:glycosyltransferase involved in cell wall biosynthesis
VPDISVIICTRNPRPDYLKATLEAIKAQTLPKNLWEFILIDNASKEPLAKSLDLSWHPNGRLVVEDELGLMPARLRGIREAAGEILVFVDDDNVLSHDYLSNALKLTQSHTFVGAFGGNIVGEFETKPENWAQALFPYLAIISVKHEQWAFGPGTIAQCVAPCGAGMVIRKSIAVYYAKRSANDPLRRGLGRKGASLASAEDVDMALCACACGMAIGRFPQLQLTHLISAGRLKPEYLLRLVEETAFSDSILQFVWRNGCLPNVAAPNGLKKMYRACESLGHRLLGRTEEGFKDRIRRALDRGLRRADQFLRTVQHGSNGDSN